MTYILGALLLVAAHVCCTLALPPCVCTRNLLPVCGTDGVTYANECLLQCENTKRNANIGILKNSSCDEKDYPRVCICTQELLPVCGSDGVTYPNECELNCQIRIKDNLSLAKVGPCDACVCTRNQKPVCGSDGKTYNNPCLLRCAQTKNPSLSEARSGPCGENVQLRVDPVKVVNN